MGVCCGQYDWRAPIRILVIQLSANPNEVKVFKAQATPLGMCDNLVNELKVLANQQRDGHSPIKSIVTGLLHERSRKGIMDGLRNFIEVDYHNAVGGLRRGTKSIQVKKPQFSEAFPEAVIREGADELTLRAEEVRSLRTLIGTKHIELERWGPPLVDADWHAFCQAIYKGCEGKEWEAMYYHYRELRQGPKSLVTVKRRRPFGQ